MTEFVRMDDRIKDALLTIIRYVKSVTGAEPTRNELTEMLNSYFILNEISNQVKYQLKNKSKKENDIDIKHPFWTLNLMGGPVHHNLAGAGIFHYSIQEALRNARKFIEKATGVDPGDDILAKSLKSSFILSEIKNQIEWQRKNSGEVSGKLEVDLDP